MNIDRDTLYKMAHLARLTVSPGEEDKLLADMSEILTWVEQLKEVDTSGVEPLIHLTQEINVLRDDVPEHTLTTGEALKNAPEREGRYFKVPKVLK